jgi:hypothetical protein
VIRVIDPSLLRDQNSFLPTTYTVLDEIAASGNLIAEFRRKELQQLEVNLDKLALGLLYPGSIENNVLGRSQNEGGHGDITTPIGSAGSLSEGELLHWNSEDGLSGEQLEALADSLNFNSLDWLPNPVFDVI